MTRTLSIVVLLFISICLVTAITDESRKQQRESRVEMSKLRQSQVEEKAPCQKCDGGDLTCCNGEKCCGYGAAAFCLTATESCCNGTMPTACDTFSESCCPDQKHGGVCCIKETSFCCPPSPMFAHPSRCCPRWQVCCHYGRYGCCDPGTKEEGKANIAHALLDSALEGFGAMTIDLSRATYTWKKVADFNTWGEMPRRFAYDPKRRVFLLPQANFTGPEPNGVPKRDITLYEIDPSSGSVKSTKVSGAVNQVTGFAFVDLLGKLLMATRDYFSDGSEAGYSFYWLDSDGTAKLISKSVRERGAADNYAGWFHACSDDGMHTYRWGYQDVINGEKTGLGVTDLTKSVATTKFLPQQLATGMGQSGDPDGELSIVQWSLKENHKHLVLGSAGNTHRTPYFGPLSEDVRFHGAAGLYAALTVHDGFETKFDRWALTLTAIPNGKPSTTVLSPWTEAETDSVAGLGIPE